MKESNPGMRGAVAALAALAACAAGAAEDAPKYGGRLDFTVGSQLPSYDGHRESTFGVIHPIRPFYSLLIRVNPDNPASPDDFVCDLCEGEVPEPTDGGTTYTFAIRSGVEFHDGTPLTAHDVKATFDKIVFPPPGVPSSRKAFFTMVESVSAPDDRRVAFVLKYPSRAFLPALAAPFNFVYAKKDLDAHGYNWHTRNVNGTGAFRFVEHQPGAFVEGVRYDRYHHAGRPYLDGFRAISAPKMALRMQAIRGDRAAIEFRGFPPKARDDLVAALGDRISVQEGDWNCALFFTPNHTVAPFDDPRVRRALTLAVDRWGGSRYLSDIAIVKTVGGIVFPGHPLAATDAELAALAGFSRDIEASRAEARRLLAEAGAEGLTFTLLNRGVDQPYKILGTWLIDQWRRIGVAVDQRVEPTGPFFDSLRRKKDFQVTMDFNCRSMVNPLANVSKFLGSAGDNYGYYDDPELEALFIRMNRETDEAAQRRLMRAYEKRVLDEMAHTGITLWWYRINPHRSYVRGWKAATSHYLNQHLDNVWLDR